MTLDPERRRARVTNTNCGVRVVQGAHRTYMTDFIRDPRTGGRARLPANLGFRLVVEEKRSFPRCDRMVERTVDKSCWDLRASPVIQTDYAARAPKLGRHRGHLVVAAVAQGWRHRRYQTVGIGVR